MQTTIEFLTLLLGSSAATGLITYFVTRHDTNKEKKDEFKKSFDDFQKKMDKRWEKQDKIDIRNEKDSLRTQMLIMINHPSKENVNEILTVAERYFVKLNGDWVMTTMFKRWCEENDIPEPVWYTEKQENKEESV